MKLYIVFFFSLFFYPSMLIKAALNQGLLHNKIFVSSVTVEGNQAVPTEAILMHVPYQEGQLFQIQDFIKELHASFPRIAHITLTGKIHDQDQIDLTIKIKEKEPIDDIVIKGNYHITLKEITKALKTETLYAVDPQELAMLSQVIKKLYTEKGFARTVINTNIEIINGKKTALFIIDEGKKSTIRKINFEGNKKITDQELRRALISKEDWLLGFMDKTSTYHPDRITYGDTHMIEELYINHGFLYAKVYNVTTNIDPHNFFLDLTFHIDEGEQYKIGSITMQDSVDIPSEKLLHAVGITTGSLYSRQSIQQAIKKIELVCAQQGYLFTTVHPSLVPQEKTKTVDITFNYEKGEKVIINRIDITGNKKTRDKVIRRKIMLQEGDLATQVMLDYSKNAVATLGFFDQKDGVSWKIKKLDAKKVNLELVVKERKTGNFAASIGFGGNGSDMRSSGNGVNARIDYSDPNFLGKGIQTSCAASWAKDEQTLILHVAQPWLFDKPILGAFDLYHKRPSYDEIKNISTSTIKEKLTGGAITSGFITQSGYQLLQNTNILFSLGCDHLAYQEKPTAAIKYFDQATNNMLNKEFQTILDKSFSPGEFFWLSHNLEQDVRNHPMHPTEGYKWKITAKAAIPTFDKHISFFKCSFDYHWYTTLIQEFDLVLHAHTFIGIAKPFGKNIIPFGELFHVGGPASVRGFQFGQIGPRFLKTSTIGAEKAFILNLELIFPITSDYSIKGVVFYDGGAGWSNPYTDGIDKSYLSGMSFDYRHSVGFGIRLLAPVPLKIDWGFKIDPRKDRFDSRKNESSSEVHFGMSYDF